MDKHIACHMYKQISISTISNRELVIKLHEAVLKNLAQARRAIDVNDFPSKNAALQRAQKSIVEIISVVDSKQIEGEQLISFLIYLMKRIIEVNVQNDLNMVSELEECLIEFKIAWRIGNGSKSKVNKK
jgi:flagellar secretion chaperone FliS